MRKRCASLYMSFYSIPDTTFLPQKPHKPFRTHYMAHLSKTLNRSNIRDHWVFNLLYHLHSKLVLLGAELECNWFRTRATTLGYFNVVEKKV